MLSLLLVAGGQSETKNGHGRGGQPNPLRSFDSVGIPVPLGRGGCQMIPMLRLGETVGFYHLRTQSF